MAKTDVAKKPYSTRLDADLLKWLEKEAKKEKRSTANLIDKILAEYKEANETTIPNKTTPTKSKRK